MKLTLDQKDWIVPHLKENISELLSHLVEGMKGTDLGRYTHGIEVVRFEGSILPRSTTN